MIRSLSESRRRYHCEHSLFSVIDNEASAYWLGFFAADGSVSHKAEGGQPVISLTIQSADVTHLRAFQKAMRCVHPIRTYLYGRRRYPAVRLAFASGPMAADLLRLGVRPQKRHGLTFPDIPAALLYHFMRGYFDGDGSITPGGVKNPSFTVVGYEAFVKEYQRILIRECDLNLTRLAWRFGTPSLVYVGRTQLQRIRAFLYRDATVYLRRKKDRFDALERAHTSSWLAPSTVK